MARPAETLVVAVTELRTLRNALPTLLGAVHPQLAVVDGALEDVMTSLYTAVVTGDEPVMLSAAGAQCRALASVNVLMSELPCPPAEPDLLFEALELVSGLLDIVAPTP